MRVQGNNPPRGGGGIPIEGEQHATELVNGNTAWNLNAQGQPVAQPANVAGDRQLMILAGPIGFIKAGLEASNAAATDRYFGRQNRTVKVVGFTTKVCDGPQPQCTRRLTGEFNNDNMHERVITWVPDPVMGDKMVEYRYSDYRDVGGGVKPRSASRPYGRSSVDPRGHSWLDLAPGRQANVAMPPGGSQQCAHRAAPQVGGEDALTLWGRPHGRRLAQQRRRRFKDFVTVIEGPLNQQRSLAVTLNQRTFPKADPLSVNTHNHFDHLVGYAPSWRKARPSSPTTASGTSISGSS